MKLFFAVFLCLNILGAIGRAQAVASPADSARDVIDRISSRHSDHVAIEQIQGENGLDVFEYEAQGGTLMLRGSTGVAICRSFYEYLRSNNLGMASWAGTTITIPPRWPDAARKRVVTPYQHRFYLNVVTYGYTMPYWTWQRWEQELDWMALHGINMPLALVGDEAIGQRVWKKLGLNHSEIDPFYTGPAHLPWQRMGNLAGLDGPLPQSWHDDQLAMQHKILDRMRALGMEPIVPAFAGFVPAALKKHYPDIELHELGWGGFPPTKLLAPDSPLFQKIGKMYVQEWEQDFGKCRYYLSDSFNEMQLPKTGKPVTDQLADYGRSIYQSIRAGDPDAIWVVQGWMFGYQRDIWNPQNVKALLSKVPDDRMLILDEACDYNGVFWKNGMNWSLFNAFDNKPWVYGVIPNMGGKTALTGVLDFYATDSCKALVSEKRGHLVGLGFAPEGIENNEVIYELMSDMAWRTEPIKLDDWIPAYCRNRYGACPEQMEKSWNLFRQSCYGTFTDHPRFGWQTGKFGSGSVNRDPKFFEGVRDFLACSDQLKKSPLYRADAVELSAIALSLKADEWFAVVRQSLDGGGGAVEESFQTHAMDRALELLTATDRLLESHPIDRLQRWLDFARDHGINNVERDGYESDARRIVTVWGPPINDYSARMWSGLIRDFYAPRMRKMFDGIKSGEKFDRKAWEENWVNGHGVSKMDPFADPVAAAVMLVNQASEETIPLAPMPDSIGRWTPGDVSTEYETLEWRITAEQLRTIKGIRFKYTGGKHRLDVQWAAVIADGKEIVRDAHFGYAGVPDSENSYHFKIPDDIHANNDCIIRASVRSAGGTDSRGQVLILQGSG